MTQQHPIDLVAILSAVAGVVGSGLLVTFGDSIDAVAPGYGKKVVGILTALSYACAIIVRVLNNPTPPAGTQAVFTTATPPVPPTPATLTTNEQLAADAKGTTP